MAVDWSKLSVMDAPGKRNGPGETAYYARFYMLAADFASLPVRGDAAPTLSPIPSTYIVDDVTADPVSVFQYIVSVTFKAALSASGGGIGISSLGARILHSSDGTEEFHMDPDFWDATPFQTGNAKHVGKELSAYGLGKYVSSIPDAAGAPLAPAAWNSAGRLNCPFTALPDAKYIGRTLSLEARTVTLYVAATAGLPTAFAGTGTLPSSLGLGTTAGQWKAIKQTYAQKYDPAGAGYYEIVRTLAKAPGTLIWDSTVVGSFTW